MLRGSKTKGHPKEVDGFRMRGSEVTRLECFTDCVFAFALTLLVVSLEVPKTFSELVGAMRGFAAFGVCFAILYQFWNYHYMFSRRYGLEDFGVRVLNAFLLFVVLLYVYPLKFLFTLFVNGLLGIRTEGGRDALTTDQAPTLFVIYGLGFAAIYLLYALLYRHAYAKREELELNEVERHDTLWAAYGFVATGCVGLVSAGVAMILPANQAGIAGFVYFSLCIIMTVHGTLEGRTRRKLTDKSVSK